MVVSPWFKITFVALMLLFVTLSGDGAAASDYAASAHANSSFGVEREGMSQYVQGNCAHCHEQHASIDGSEPLPINGSASDSLLFNDLEATCFACHGGTSQTGTIVNNNYAATFGGAAPESTTIQAAFSKASSHNLADVKTFLEDNSGLPDAPAGGNPCSGCHNVHLAKANKRSPGDPTNTAISLPSDHNNLWGDDTAPDERMTAWGVGAYQAPQRVGGYSEPDGKSNDRATQAAKTPDYNTFCTDCHNSTNNIWSTRLGRNLRKIDWNSEKHGGGAATDVAGVQDVLAPYADSSLGSYVLSCLDCHEPHGSSNKFLLRKVVNARWVNFPPGSNAIKNLCKSCHNVNAPANAYDGGDLYIYDIYYCHHAEQYESTTCSACHGGADSSCLECHSHGWSF